MDFPNVPTTDSQSAVPVGDNSSASRPGSVSEACPTFSPTLASETKPVISEAEDLNLKRASISQSQDQILAKFMEAVQARDMARLRDLADSLRQREEDSLLVPSTNASNESGHPAISNADSPQNTFPADIGTVTASATVPSKNRASSNSSPSSESGPCDRSNAQVLCTQVVNLTPSSDLTSFTSAHPSTSTSESSQFSAAPSVPSATVTLATVPSALLCPPTEAKPVESPDVPEGGFQSLLRQETSPLNVSLTSRESVPSPKSRETVLKSTSAGDSLPAPANFNQPMCCLPTPVTTPPSTVTSQAHLPSSAALTYPTDLPVPTTKSLPAVQTVTATHTSDSNFTPGMMYLQTATGQLIPFNSQGSAVSSICAPGYSVESMSTCVAPPVISSSQNSAAVYTQPNSQTLPKSSSLPPFIPRTIRVLNASGEFAPVSIDLPGMPPILLQVTPLAGARVDEQFSINVPTQLILSALANCGPLTGGPIMISVAPSGIIPNVATGISMPIAMGQPLNSVGSTTLANASPEAITSSTPSSAVAGPAQLPKSTISVTPATTFLPLSASVSLNSKSVTLTTVVHSTTTTSMPVSGRRMRAIAPKPSNLRPTLPGLASVQKPSTKFSKRSTVLQSLVPSTTCSAHTSMQLSAPSLNLPPPSSVTVTPVNLPPTTFSFTTKSCVSNIPQPLLRKPTICPNTTIAPITLSSAPLSTSRSRSRRKLPSSQLIAPQISTFPSILPSTSSNSGSSFMMGSDALGNPTAFQNGTDSLTSFVNTAQPFLQSTSILPTVSGCAPVPTSVTPMLLSSGQPGQFILSNAATASGTFFVNTPNGLVPAMRVGSTNQPQTQAVAKFQPGSLTVPSIRGQDGSISGLQSCDPNSVGSELTYYPSVSNSNFSSIVVSGATGLSTDTVAGSLDGLPPPLPVGAASLPQPSCPPLIFANGSNVSTGGGHFLMSSHLQPSSTIMFQPSVQSVLSGSQPMVGSTSDYLQTFPSCTTTLPDSQSVGDFLQSQTLTSTHPFLSASGSEFLIATNDSSQLPYTSLIQTATSGSFSGHPTSTIDSKDTTCTDTVSSITSDDPSGKYDILSLAYRIANPDEKEADLNALDEKLDEFASHNMGAFEDSSGFFADLMKNYQQDLGANFKLDVDRSDEIPKEVVCLLPSTNGLGVFDSCNSVVPTSETGLPVSSDQSTTGDAEIDALLAAAAMVGAVSGVGDDQSAVSVPVDSLPVSIGSSDFTKQATAFERAPVNAIPTTTTIPTSVSSENNFVADVITSSDFSQSLYESLASLGHPLLPEENQDSLALTPLSVPVSLDCPITENTFVSSLAASHSFQHDSLPLPTSESESFMDRLMYCSKESVDFNAVFGPETSDLDVSNPGVSDSFLNSLANADADLELPDQQSGDYSHDNLIVDKLNNETQLESCLKSVNETDEPSAASGEPLTVADGTSLADSNTPTTSTSVPVSSNVCSQPENSSVSMRLFDSAAHPKSRFSTEADDDDFISNFPISSRDYTTEEQFNQALMLLGPQSDSESQDETSSQYLNSLVTSSSPKMEEAEQKPTSCLSPAVQQVDQPTSADLTVVKCDSKESSASLSQSPLLAGLAADLREDHHGSSWPPVLTANNSRVIEENASPPGEATLSMHDEVEQAHSTNVPSLLVPDMSGAEVRPLPDENATAAELHTAYDDDILNDDSGSELDFLPSHDEKLLFRLSDEHLTFDKLPSCSSQTEQTQRPPVAEEISSKLTPRPRRVRSTSSPVPVPLKSPKPDVRRSPRTANSGPGRPKKTNSSIHSSASSHSQQSTAHRLRSNANAENSGARQDLNSSSQRFTRASARRNSCSNASQRAAASTLKRMKSENIVRSPGTTNAKEPLTRRLRSRCSLTSELPNIIQASSPTMLLSVLNSTAAFEEDVTVDSESDISPVKSNLESSLANLDRILKSCQRRSVGDKSTGMATDNESVVISSSTSEEISSSKSTNNSTSGATTDALTSEGTQPASQSTVVTESSRVGSTDASWGTESLPLSEGSQNPNEAIRTQSEEFEPVVRSPAASTSAKRTPQSSLFDSPQMETFLNGTRNCKSTECLSGSTSSTPIEARSLWAMLTTSRPTSFGLVASTSVSLPPPPSSANSALSLPVNLEVPSVDSHGLFGTVAEPSRDEAEEDFTDDVCKEAPGPPIKDAVRGESTPSPRRSESLSVSAFESHSHSPSPQVVRRGRKRKHRRTSTHSTGLSSTPGPTPVKQQEKAENAQDRNPSLVAASDLLASVRPISLLPDIPLPVCTSFSVSGLAGATQGSFARFVNSTVLPSFSEISSSECTFVNKAARQHLSVTESETSRYAPKKDSQGAEADTPAAFESSDIQNPESTSSCKSTSSQPLLPDSIRLSFATELFKPVFSDPLKPSPLTLPFSANEKGSLHTSTGSSTSVTQQTPKTPIKPEASFSISSCGVFSSLASFGTSLSPVQQYAPAGFSRPMPGMTFGSFAGAAAFRSESFGVLAAKARQNVANPPPFAAKNVSSGPTFEAGVTRPATFSDIAKIARETHTQESKQNKDCSKNVVSFDISSSSSVNILQGSPRMSSFAFGRSPHATPSEGIRPLSPPLSGSAELSLSEVSSSGNDFAAPSNEPMCPASCEAKTHSDNAVVKCAKPVGRKFRRRGRHSRRASRRPKLPSPTPPNIAVLSNVTHEDTEGSATNEEPTPLDCSPLAPPDSPLTVTHHEEVYFLTESQEMCLEDVAPSPTWHSVHWNYTLPPPTFFATLTAQCSIFRSEICRQQHYDEVEIIELTDFPGLEVATNPGEPVLENLGCLEVGDARKASDESSDHEDGRAQASTSPDSGHVGAVNVGETDDSDPVSSHVVSEVHRSDPSLEPLTAEEPQRLPIRLKLKLTPVSVSKSSFATNVTGGGIGKLRLRLQRDRLGHKKSKTLRSKSRRLLHVASLEVSSSQPVESYQACLTEPVMRTPSSSTASAVFASPVIRLSRVGATPSPLSSSAQLGPRPAQTNTDTHEPAENTVDPPQTVLPTRIKQPIWAAARRGRRVRCRSSRPGAGAFGVASASAALSSRYLQSTVCPPTVSSGRFSKKIFSTSKEDRRSSAIQVIRPWRGGICALVSPKRGSFSKSDRGGKKKLLHSTSATSVTAVTPVTNQEIASTTSVDNLTSWADGNRNPLHQRLRGGTNLRCRSSTGVRKRCPRVPSSSPRETFQPIRLIIRLGRDTPTTATASGGDDKIASRNLSGTPPSDSPITSPNASSKGSLHESQLSPPSAAVSLSGEQATRSSSQDMGDLFSNIVFLVAPEAEAFIDSNQARVRRLRNQAMGDVYGHRDTNHDEDGDGDDSSSSDEMPSGPGSMREATAAPPQVVHTYQASHLRENSPVSEHQHQLYRQQEQHRDKVKADQPPPSSGINYRNLNLRSDDGLLREYSFPLEISTTAAAASPPNARTVSQPVASQQLHFQAQLTDLGSGHSSPPTTSSPSPISRSEEPTVVWTKSPPLTGSKCYAALQSETAQSSLGYSSADNSSTTHCPAVNMVGSSVQQQPPPLSQQKHPGLQLNEAANCASARSSSSSTSSSLSVLPPPSTISPPHSFSLNINPDSHTTDRSDSETHCGFANGSEEHLQDSSMATTTTAAAAYMPHSALETEGNNPYPSLGYSKVPFSSSEQYAHVSASAVSDSTRHQQDTLHSTYADLAPLQAGRRRLSTGAHGGRKEADAEEKQHQQNALAAASVYAAAAAAAYYDHWATSLFCNFSQAGGPSAPSTAAAALSAVSGLPVGSKQASRGPPCTPWQLTLGDVPQRDDTGAYCGTAPASPTLRHPMTQAEHSTTHVGYPPPPPANHHHALESHPRLDQTETKARRQPDFPPFFHSYESNSATRAPSSQDRLHQQPPPSAYGQHQQQQASLRQPQQAADSAYFIGNPSSAPPPVSAVNEGSRFNLAGTDGIGSLHYEPSEAAIYPYGGMYSQYPQHYAHRQQNFGLPEQHQQWLNYGLHQLEWSRHMLRPPEVQIAGDFSPNRTFVGEGLSRRLTQDMDGRTKDG
ncbi:hypothetical protein AAHC03_04403 [Spirometra sp. Aus1]